MDMLFDPQFWIVNVAIVFVLGLLRALPDLFLWHLRRQTRRAAEDMSSDEAERFWDERDKLVSEAPGRWLEMVVTYSFLRKAHRRQRNKASRLRAETSTVKTAQPAADPSRTSKKPARRPRTPLSSRLTRAFTSFGGGVIGGKEGADYVPGLESRTGRSQEPRHQGDPRTQQRDRRLHHPDHHQDHAQGALRPGRPSTGGPQGASHSHRPGADHQHAARHDRIL